MAVLLEWEVDAEPFSVTFLCLTPPSSPPPSITHRPPTRDKEPVLITDSPLLKHSLLSPARLHSSHTSTLIPLFLTGRPSAGPAGWIRPEADAVCFDPKQSTLQNQRNWSLEDPVYRVQTRPHVLFSLTLRWSEQILQNFNRDNNSDDPEWVQQFRTPKNIFYTLNDLLC